jgi:hypothetical protein
MGRELDRDEAQLGLSYASLQRKEAMMAGLPRWRCSYLADMAHVRAELKRSTTLSHFWGQK